jgi:Family of unknown function (DUF5752)
MSPQPQQPFAIKDCALITIALGQAAFDLRELRDRVSQVSASSLRHHFIEGLLRPSFDDPEFRNDFALWARDALRDDVLAERLAVIDPFEHADIEELRGVLVDAIEDRLFETAVSPAPPGHEFRFLRSQLVVFGTGRAARKPEDLVELLPHLSPGSVYYHFVEARLRPPREEDDFSGWLAGWGESGAAARTGLAAVDPMFGSLTDLRGRITAVFRDTLGGAA